MCLVNKQSIFNAKYIRVAVVHLALVFSCNSSSIGSNVGRSVGLSVPNHESK